MKFNFKLKGEGLEKLQKLNLLKNSKMSSTIGIHPEDNQRQNKKEGGDETNADILANHVFGVISKNIPRRDPLYIPILRNKELIKKKFEIYVVSQVLNKLKNNNKIDTKSIVSDALEEIMSFILVDVVHKEIFSEGQGSWEKLSKQTIENKGGRTQQLIDTKELFDKIKYKILNNDNK